MNLSKCAYVAFFLLFPLLGFASESSDSVINVEISNSNGGIERLFGLDEQLKVSATTARFDLFGSARSSTATDRPAMISSQERHSDSAWHISWLSLFLSGLVFCWTILNSYSNSRRSVYDGYWLREVILPDINEAVQTYLDGVKKFILDDDSHEDFYGVWDLTEAFRDRILILRGFSPDVYQKISSLCSDFSDAVDAYAFSLEDGANKDKVYGLENIPRIRNFSEYSSDFHSGIVKELVRFHFRFSGFFKFRWPF